MSKDTGGNSTVSGSKSVPSDTNGSTFSTEGLRMGDRLKSAENACQQSEQFCGQTSALTESNQETTLQSDQLIFLSPMVYLRHENHLRSFENGANRMTKRDTPLSNQLHESVSKFFNNNGVAGVVQVKRGESWRQDSRDRRLRAVVIVSESEQQKAKRQALRSSKERRA